MESPFCETGFEQLAKQVWKAHIGKLGLNAAFGKLPLQSLVSKADSGKLSLKI